MSNDLSGNEPHHLAFESIKQSSEQGDFWLARDLAPVLSYPHWRNFLPVIEKARIACERSGHKAEDHFDEMRKMVSLGSGANRTVSDYRLSRYACYLIVQNGDPSKPVIANGQTYFARKRLKKSQKILDHMGSTELAANLFRATQAEDKLRRDGVSGKQMANQTHFKVGRKVRDTIRELGGTMPEALPTPATSIQQIERAQRKLAGKKNAI